MYSCSPLFTFGLNTALETFSKDQNIVMFAEMLSSWVQTRSVNCITVHAKDAGLPGRNLTFWMFL